MDFKSMLNQLSQLSEATKETPTGRVHKAEPGGYGRKFDTDEEGDEKKKDEKKDDAPKKRGRPPATGEHSAEEKKKAKARDEAGKELQSFIVGNKPKDFDKKKGVKVKGKAQSGEGKKKKSVKEWVEEIENKYVAEAALTPTQTLVPGVQAGGTAAVPTIIDTKNNPALKAALDKAAKDKQITTVSIPQTGTSPAPSGSTGQAPAGQTQVKEKWAGDAKVKATGEYAGKSVEELKSMLASLKKSGPHAEDSPEAKKQRQINFALRAKGHWKKGEGAAQKESMAEGDIPSVSGVDTRGAGLGVGRSETTLEDNTKKVNESMDHKLKAAHHMGKSHALSKEAYSCKYDDMDEARCYHEGYKEGLDECYGQMPIVGLVSEKDAMPATVHGMADQAAGLDEMDMAEMDKSEWMKHKAKTTPGDTFKAFGQTMHDKDVLEADSFFENWDKELNALLTESEEVSEGMTVSISKGQQGMPDSVSVTAQDGEAEQLLGLIKHAGLGLFGGEEAMDHIGAGADDQLMQKQGGIEVVGDHDGMMSLIKKVTGAGSNDADYEEEGGEEEHDHDHEQEECSECGYMESKCQCEKEKVEEVESEDQMTYEVAEDNAPDSGAAETTADEEAEAAEDQALATKSMAESAQLDEWANEAGKKGTDTSFEQDIEFMTKVIAGGLNKPKSTGQTTIPVIAGQEDRMGVTNESLVDWKKLAGI